MSDHDKSSKLSRAVAALDSFLAQSSAIGLKEIGVGWPVESQGVGREIDILAHVEIFGRGHTLACGVSSDSRPEQVRIKLKQLRGLIAFLPGKVTPVLILPVLSPEARTLCEEDNTACLDFHGNGRLAIDEIFVSMRSSPRRVLHGAASGAEKPSRRAVAALTANAEAGKEVLRGFPPTPDHAAPPNRAAASCGATRTH